MTLLLIALATVLLLSFAAGLVRVVRGPTPADRMTAAQLVGTNGVGVLLLLADVAEAGALRDVAMTLALLTILATIAFVRRASTLRSERR